MPAGRHTKGRNQHQRNISGGNSRVGLHQLQLTQKDAAAQPKHQQLKRAGHSAVEVNPQRNTSPFPRTNSRVQSKEKIVGLTQKRAPSAGSTKRQQLAQAQTRPTKGRAGFSIARSDETDEDDESSEWVSSESGAATPQNGAEDAEGRGRGVTTTTPGEREKAPVTGALEPSGGLGEREKVNKEANGDADRALGASTGQLTPRAESLLQFGLTRSDPDTHAAANVTVRPHQHAHALPHPQGAEPPLIRTEPATPSPVPQPTPTSLTLVPEVPTPTTSKLASERPIVQPIRQARSEAPSPTQLKSAAPKRHPLIRQLSSHADSRGSDMITPHPLIRGQSRHSSLKPAKLAPLTVNPENAKAQLLASPLSAGLAPDSSQSFRLRTPSDASTDSRDRIPSPKGSISSLHSVATLPAPNTARVGARSGVDRSRTLSVLSTSSAALNSLSKLPAMSRPATPPLTVHFPAESRRDVQDGFIHHQLLPPNFAASAMATFAYYGPLLDSYDRVMQAKNRR